MTSYAHELEQIRERALFMGAKVEDMIAASLRAYRDRDPLLARRTIRADVYIDRLEMELDERCVRALARWKPVASDLRLVTVVLKLVTKLERIGDLAETICRRVVELDGLIHFGPPECREPLEAMARDVSDMVRDALDAFASGDTVRAARVIERDHAVDASYARCFPELLNLMTKDGGNVPVAAAVASVAKALERIGDEATNVAELVHFMQHGQHARIDPRLRDAGASSRLDASALQVGHDADTSDG